ncbi:hypothetical protein [Guptibacillus hwajinpoensis]|uniref:hypothetical protein n=1 Tax=Guptibacillus hwajinpoensis TaxID=208199 RepID=UPI001CFE8FEA|nr:hypothetical protein [Pseudalkalibacillus hwajinpoensis]WLR60628.1 hypothetical protein LC071_04535 [Pseudalkalibacillus hwajinpoensis]
MVNVQFPSVIEKIQQEKEHIKKIYNGVHQKIISMELSSDENVTVNWVIENLDFASFLDDLTAEQVTIVKRFRDVYIGVYLAAGILAADHFAMRILYSK